MNQLAMAWAPSPNGRKPRPRRVRVHALVPHGVNPNLVITVFPDGTLGIREARRRLEVFTSVGKLYAQLVRQEIAEKRRRRRRDA